MHRGNLGIRCECMTLIKRKRNMVAEGISMDDFPENCVGRWSNNFTSEEPMICLGRFSNTFATEGSPIIFTETQ